MNDAMRRCERREWARMHFRQQTTAQRMLPELQRGVVTSVMRLRATHLVNLAILREPHHGRKRDFRQSCDVRPCASISGYARVCVIGSRTLANAG
ncbi:hypothetical protein [Saliniramus sp.]|uniref:hypothetical protein n=1 Tax=Saliniramus sp. TaxID=2986772 RepID=UPI002C94D0BA|nr:hypothetical protein [Saliniramus sp.]HMB12280.1 hypothetical protein [Saliniramus sp.]